MNQPHVLVDTSAAIALIVTSHEAHTDTLDALDGLTLGVSGHTWFETYSVLTRLPQPARRSSAEVRKILAHDFRESCFLSPEAAASLTDELPALGIAGGSVYDALVAAAAREHRKRLVSRDVRATDVYRKMGIDVQLLA